MSPLGFAILLIFAGILGAVSGKLPSVGWRVSACMAVFAFCVGAGALVGLPAGSALGIPLEDPRLFFGFIWVGAGVGLPVSLMAARAFGEKTYAEYWDWLTARPKMTKRRLVGFWYAFCAILFAFGMLVLRFGLPWR